MTGPSCWSGVVCTRGTLSLAARMLLVGVLIELFNLYLRYRQRSAAIVPIGLALSLIVVSFRKRGCPGCTPGPSCCSARTSPVIELVCPGALNTARKTMDLNESVFSRCQDSSAPSYIPKGFSYQSYTCRPRALSDQSQSLSLAYLGAPFNCASVTFT